MGCTGQGGAEDNAAGTNPQALHQQTVRLCGLPPLLVWFTQTGRTLPWKSLSCPGDKSCSKSNRDFDLILSPEGNSDWFGQNPSPPPDDDGLQVFDVEVASFQSLLAVVHDTVKTVTAAGRGLELRSANVNLLELIRNLANNQVGGCVDADSDSSRGWVAWS